MISHLFSLIALWEIERDFNLGWAVHAEYIGGSQSTIRKETDTAFAYRGAQFVWIFSAWGLDESVDLAVLNDIVDTMMNDLGPAYSICEQDFFYILHSLI
jgi:hypothetical protein